MQHVIEELRKALPPVFAGTSLGELTGNAIHWPTIQNRRALRQIPDGCFVRSGPRFLWFETGFSIGGRRHFRRRVSPTVAGLAAVKMPIGRHEPCRQKQHDRLFGIAGRALMTYAWRRSQRLL